MPGGGSQTTTQSNTIDPKLMALYQQNYAQNEKLADTPFQAYTGQMVAPLSSATTQAQGILQGVSSNNTGASDLNTASDATQGILNGPGVTAGQISSTDLTPYLNPYTDDVVNSSMSDLERARQIQQVQDNQNATGNNAFGGSRQGVQDSLTNDAYLRNVASTTSALRSAGYDKAVSAAQGDITNKLNADEFNTNTKSSAATTLANMSNEELTQALQRAGALASSGQITDQNNQAQDDAAYQEFMRMINDPIQKQSLLNSALSSQPVQQTTTSTAKSSPGLGDILGGILKAGASVAAFA